MKFGGDDSQGQFMISEFKSIEKLSEQLQYIIVLLYSLPDDLRGLFDAEIEKFEKIWSDLNFMREVKHRDSLVHEYSTEYFGQDYGNHDPFKFKTLTERQINNISLEIMGVLGRIIKVTRDRGVHIGDEA